MERSAERCSVILTAPSSPSEKSSMTQSCSKGSCLQPQDPLPQGPASYQLVAGKDGSPDCFFVPPPLAADGEWGAGRRQWYPACILAGLCVQGWETVHPGGLKGPPRAGGRVGCGLNPSHLWTAQPVHSSPGSFRRDHGSSILPGALEWSPDWTYSQEMCLSLCELLAPVSFMPEEVGLNGA